MILESRYGLTGRPGCNMGCRMTEGQDACLARGESTENFALG